MGIYKRKAEGTDVWYLRYWDSDGKLVRKSSGTTNKAEAQAMLAEAEAEVALQKRAKLEQAVTGEKPTTTPRRFNWRRWTTDVVLWDSDIPQSRYGRLLARKTERPDVTALGEIIATVQVPDRKAAIAAGHRFLEEFAHEAHGARSIEVHISAPEQTVEEEREAWLRSYKVTPEAMEHAKALGIRGDVERYLQSIAFHSEGYDHPRANRRYGNVLIRLEGLIVSWVEIVDDSSEPV
jgi:hypothetical protein